MSNNIKEEWNHSASAYEEFNAKENSYSYNIEWPCIKTMSGSIYRNANLHDN